MKRKALQLTVYSIFGLTFFCVTPASAQETKKITLKEAIDLSITNSKQLKINQAQINEAIASVKAASDNRLPDLSITGAALYLPVKPNVKLPKSSGSNDSSSTSIPNISQAYYGLANASLPIYSGGKLQYAIESAKYLEQAAKLDADNNRDEVIFNTVNAYANLYKAEAAVKLVKENLEQANQRDTDFINLEKNGLIARNDLLKAELQSSNVELALADAQTNWKLACVNMNLMLGLSEQTELDPDSTDLLQINEIKSFDQYEQSALQSRKDIQALSIRTKAANVGIKSAKSEYYPSIAITGGYAALYIPNFVTLTNAIDIGVGVSYSLSSLWKTKTKIQQAQARVQELQANEALLDDNVRLEINQAYQNYLLSQKKIDVYQKAIDQSVENYRITKNKYDNALETTTDLLDADVAELQAKLNYANAKADAVVAYNKLLQTAGLLN